MLYLSGVSLSLFLSLLLFTKKNHTAADRLLATWLVFTTLHLLLFYFQTLRLYPFLLGAGMQLPLLHGPFLYAYARALTNRMLSPAMLTLHFAPAIAFFAYSVPFLLQPTEFKQAVFDNHGAGYETYNIIHLAAIIASGVVYVILSMIVLRRHRRRIADEFSNIDRINLTWLQYLIYWIGAIWIGVLLRNDTVVFTTATLFVAFIGYFGIRQTGIFLSAHAPTTPVEPEEKKKYQKSGLSPEASDRIHSELSALVSSQKVFRDKDLSLTDLAARLNVPQNYLSQVINEREDKTFYDYINTLRVEEFKKLAASPESRKYTLLGLAQECGFNSKSSFNRYFRKVTGQSPSQFVPEMRE